MAVFLGLDYDSQILHISIILFLFFFNSCLCRDTCMMLQLLLLVGDKLFKSFPGQELLL